MAEHAFALESAPLGTEKHEGVYEEHTTKRKPRIIPYSYPELLFADDSSLLEETIETTLPNPQEFTGKMIAPRLTLQSQRTHLSPFKELPIEVTSLILVKAVRGVIVFTPEKLHKDDGFQCNGEVFVLTWVCSSWRQIILSIPSFWTSYIIWKSNSTLQSFRPMIDCLKELLLRSGSVVPLSFSVHGPDTMYPVLNTLVMHASRWKEVSLRFLDSPQRALEVIHEQTTSFPNLKFLLISSRQTHILKLGSLGKVFIHCPHLDYLDLTSFHIREVFDLQHLTTLEMSVYIGESLALLLQRCPVLETLCLSHSTLDPVSDLLEIVPIPSNVHHPHLKRLSVNHLDDGYAVTFWRNVLLPNLTEVQADFDHDGDESRFCEFKQMLVDSQCVLDRVHLTWDENFESSIESLVEGIPLSSQSHTHRWYAGIDGLYKIFLAVPSYEIPCYDCIYGQGNK